MEIFDRYIENETAKLRTADVRKELVNSLTRVITLYPPTDDRTVWAFNGFYSGPTSIALLFYNLSEVYQNIYIKDQPLIAWALLYHGLGAGRQNQPPTPSNCGIANECLAWIALEAVLSLDANHARQLCSFATEINSLSDHGSNEWCYGRAGYLYFLRLCRSVFTKDVPDAETVGVINSTIVSTVTRILEAPQPWAWSHKRYIGASHGTIGIITQLVLSGFPERHHYRLRLMILSLLDRQFSDGNFPVGYRRGSSSDHLVQFCHGGPGFVISLRTLLPYFDEISEDITRAIEKAQSDVWKRGLLKKDPCLCHGIAGNALALDAYDKFLHFLSHMNTEVIEEQWNLSPHRQNQVGLFTGEPGRAWCWALADTGVAKTCIGYNDV